MRFGHFDDDAREYVIDAARHAAAVDQLPRQRGLLRDHLQHRRRLLVLPRRPAAAADPLPLQQRAVRRRRPLPLPARRRQRRCWSRLAADPRERRGATSCRHGLGYTVIASRRAGIAAETLYFVPLGETLEVWRARITNHRDSAGAAVAVQRDRVLPVGRAGRRHQLPAQLLDRRGRGRRRRDLPQDRVPRAARPLRLLRLLGAAGRVRHAARRVPRPVPRLGPAGRRSSAGGSATRSPTAGQPIGSHHVALELAPGETREVVFVLGYAENPADAKFDPPGSQTIDKRARPPGHRALPRPSNVERGVRAAARALGSSCSAACRSRRRNEHADRMVNIWNAYQCMVTFNLSRSASLFESGIGRGMGFRDSNQDLLGFVAHGPRRGRASGSSTSRRPSCRPAARTTSTSR